MKMLSTPTVAAMTDYPSYVHNCTRNAQCEPPWLAPLPGVPYLQLYVDYGTEKPNTVEFWIQDICDSDAEQVFPSNYVVGQTPEGNWYGVYKYLNTPIAAVTGFVVWHSALVETDAGVVERTFFSEAFVVEPCLPLMKVKSCQPEGATITAFDVNDVYYGLPVNEDYLGLEGIRYFHIAFVRNGKVKELTNKATFTSSLVANFRTVLEKTWQLESEMVPQWYKDVLLAIYVRGAVQVNDGKTYLVSDLNFEGINDDDLSWKPFAVLKETKRLYYGCDSSECVECCSPIVYDATVTYESESDVSGSGSVSESESISESEPPPILSGPFKLGLTTGGLCSEFNIESLFWEGPGPALVPGNVLYTDNMLTTPITGWFYVSDSVGTEIFSISDTTGEVGLTTGAGC